MGCVWVVWRSAAGVVWVGCGSRMRVGTLELSVHILASVIYIGRALHTPDCIVPVCMAACTAVLCTLLVTMFVHITMCICESVCTFAYVCCCVCPCVCVRTCANLGLTQPGGSPCTILFVVGILVFFYTTVNIGC